MWHKNFVEKIPGYSLMYLTSEKWFNSIRKRAPEEEKKNAVDCVSPVKGKGAGLKRWEEWVEWVKGVET